MVARQKTTTRKAGDHYWLSYISPLTGKRRRLTLKETGLLPTKEIADQWAEIHMDRIIAMDMAAAGHEEWRSKGEMVKLFNEFKAFKKLNQPHSYMVQVGALKNYVLPYFMVERNLPNPNDWHHHDQRFKAWLLTEDATKKKKSLAVGTANTAINAYNKFCEWLRDHQKTLTHTNCRPLVAYEGHLLNRRGADDLIDDDEFRMVAAQLRTMDDLWADMWIVQRHLGTRVNETVGLSLESVTTKIPPFILDAFKAIGMVNSYGGVYLDSQPKQQYIKRVGVEILRKPLKGRPEISPKYARSIPIYDVDVWNILATRHGVQKEALLNGTYGHDKKNYLLFDGAQINNYLTAIRDAYEAIGLKSKGSHAHRHTRTTELTLAGLPNDTEELVMGHKGQARERYQHIIEIINRRTQVGKDMDDIKPVQKVVG